MGLSIVLFVLLLVALAHLHNTSEFFRQTTTLSTSTTSRSLSIEEEEEEEEGGGHGLQMSSEGQESESVFASSLSKYALFVSALVAFIGNCAFLIYAFWTGR